MVEALLEEGMEQHKERLVVVGMDDMVGRL